MMLYLRKEVKECQSKNDDILKFDNDIINVFVNSLYKKIFYNIVYLTVFLHPYSHITHFVF